MDVKRFVESISSLEGNFDLIDGMYIVDAKSLMGICAMDLSKPILLRIQKDTKKAMQAIEKFIVDKSERQIDEDETCDSPRVVKPRVILEEV